MNELRFTSIKLISGEEILCYVLDFIEYPDSNTHIVIRDPLKIEYVDNKRKGSVKYKLTPWINFSSKREYEIDIYKIFSMSIVTDQEAKDHHSRHFHRQLTSTPIKAKNGYVGSVKDFKKLLEKIYRDVDSYDAS